MLMGIVLCLAALTTPVEVESENEELLPELREEIVFEDDCELSEEDLLVFLDDEESILTDTDCSCQCQPSEP